MERRRDSEAHFVSKFVAICDVLFQGNTPAQIAPDVPAEKFWQVLFALEVDREFLVATLGDMSAGDCLGKVKPVLTGLVEGCIQVLRSADASVKTKSHAAITLAAVSRGIMNKNLTAWEVMEVFAGSVGKSGEVFKNFMAAIEGILSDTSAPASLRHDVLQMAVTFVCGVGQLSAGAYFLRHDLFPSITVMITAPDTGQYMFEAALFLTLLANFHRFDGGKMNPYLSRIKDTTNMELMRRICCAANYAAARTEKGYQALFDDSPATGTVGSVLSTLRLDRALAANPINRSRKRFEYMPIEACVIPLSLSEFLRGSPAFRAAFVKTLEVKEGENEGPETSSKFTPLPLTLLSMSSYILAHASSSNSPRAMGYANLALNTLLVISESEEILGALRQDTTVNIRICRQRAPPLPLFEAPRPPLCAFLDCCILWLRHNLQKKLEVLGYITCIRACYQVLRYLQKERARLEYHWQELWRALISLLGYLVSKLDKLAATGGVEQLIQETLLLVGFALCRSEQLLPSPAAVHELVYEVVRSADVFRKQRALLDKLANPVPDAAQARSSGNTSRANQALENIIALVDKYEKKRKGVGVRSASQGLRAVAKDIEQDGLSYGTDTHGTDDPPGQSEDVAASGN